MQAVAAGCGIPDQVSNHVRPVTKDVQQALLALILLVLTTYAHDGQSSVSNNRLYVSVWGGGGGTLVSVTPLCFTQLIRMDNSKSPLS